MKDGKNGLIKSKIKYIFNNKVLLKVNSLFFISFYNVIKPLSSQSIAVKASCIENKGLLVILYLNASASTSLIKSC